MSRVLIAAVLALLPCLLPACGGASEQATAPDPSPHLAPQPATLSFAATEGTADPAPRSVQIREVGGGELAWTATESCPWFTISATSGGANEGFDVIVSTAGLAIGAYTDAITLTDESAGNSPLEVSVSLTISAVLPTTCGCTALPAPTGETVTVAAVPELEQALAQANTGAGPKTILVADGTYTLSQLLHVTGTDITVRGLSGDRDAVVLRGDGMAGGVSHVFLVAGSRFTAADLTVGWIYYHAIQVQGEQDVDDVLIHNVRFADTGEQMLKVSYTAGVDVGSDRGIVECCLFEYTAGIGPQYYIGGVDCHQGTDWIVRNNVFLHIRSPESALAEHAIHFWSDSTGTLVEGNVIVDCDRGIGFGLGDRGHGSGLIRNNMVHTTRDVGIGLESAAGVTVVHNTVHANGYANAIEFRFAETDATIVGNLIVGAVARRDGAAGTDSGNLEVTDPTDVFVDPASGDLHLKSAVPTVVDQGQARPDVLLDIDCEPRPQGAAPDLGADEWTGG